MVPTVKAKKGNARPKVRPEENTETVQGQMEDEPPLSQATVAADSIIKELFERILMIQLINRDLWPALPLDEEESSNEFKGLATYRESAELWITQMCRTTIPSFRRFSYCWTADIEDADPARWTMLRRVRRPLGKNGTARDKMSYGQVSVSNVTIGPLERSNCRIHLRGRCRDLLTDAFLNAGWQMHPVEEDSRFVIQPIYPDQTSPGRQIVPGMVRQANHNSTDTAHKNSERLQATRDPGLVQYRYGKYLELAWADQQGDHTANVFLKESSRPVVVLLLNYICIYVRLVLTDSNTTASPILHLTPLDFNFWGHTKDLIYEVEINTKGQLQKPVIDAANQIRKNPEMLNSVYENWYRRTQMCLNANGRHTEHLL
ncbi:hypothetical protein GEV33_006316 [Tenebrio molitor]|uniref:Uncharacterized protein n=1 Tax=Tenebrio molitor TaxID=7067 RepID=A0A8J6HCV7_TENMO|nr:hypothetical protein GEV33_006316 [Tenebrio molitor]